ncbi:hypothetical protein D9756_008038 [Leucocoprinus leucothites]|uniref:Ricin B lectin domain-containing protein n=1 Tax=Leucocoprinus leucothites TaxID=201217 RepID=A0A8H5D4G4_9AGAR|nr:hypothetical protein D9756_008038 [Leucoagaricus leucothites]
MFAKLSLTLLALSAAVMAQFPDGSFFIRNVASGKVLDVQHGSTECYPLGRKESGFDNQLWRYDNGFLVNKASGLVLEVPGFEGGGDISPGTALQINAKRERPESLNQLWAYNYQYIMPYDPKVVIWGQDGDVSTPGSKAVVDRMIHEEVTQKWMFDLP